jgi:tripartite-type tricarboxylate transporter receptor subunit TctC
MLHRRHFMTLAAGSLAAPTLISSHALGSIWPSKPVRLVVPFAPGGATDVTARIVANRLQDVWGQSIVVDNRPGAGGNIGADMVAKSDPDGYTLFIVGPGQATNKFLYPSLNYDPVADFAPVSLLILQPNIMCIPNSLAARSVQEFIDYCKANRGKVSYASSGNGTSLHLSGELFKRMAGVEMTHIPYRGAGPAMNDLIPGRVDVMFDNAPSILPHVEAGSVRGLAVTTAKRMLKAPALPTIAESGVPGFDVSSWFAFFYPAKTPAEIVAKVNADTVAALAHMSVKPRLEELGAEVASSTPAQLAAHLQAEMDKWGPVIAAAKIRIDN